MGRPGKFGEIDTGKEARTLPTGSTASATTIMRVADAHIRFPDMSSPQMAKMLGMNPTYIRHIRQTPMFKARIDSAYDIRPLMRQRLKNQTINSMEFVDKLHTRATDELEKVAPDSTIISSATRASIETMKGVGLLAEHQITDNRTPDANDIVTLVKQANAVQEAFLQGLAKARAELAENAPMEVVEPDEVDISDSQESDG